MKKTYWIMGFVLAGIVFIGGLYGYSEYIRAETIKESKMQVDIASSESIKASLNLYYAFYGQYPVDTDSLIEGLSDKRNYEILKTEPRDTSTLNRSIKDLKDFEYSVRGDQKAYKFTYTDQYGEKQVVEGEYQKEFH